MRQEHADLQRKHTAERMQEKRMRTKVGQGGKQDQEARNRLQGLIIASEESVGLVKIHEILRTQVDQFQKKRKLLLHPSASA